MKAASTPTLHADFVSLDPSALARLQVGQLGAASCFLLAPGRFAHPV